MPFESRSLLFPGCVMPNLKVDAAELLKEPWHHRCFPLDDDEMELTEMGPMFAVESVYLRRNYMAHQYSSIKRAHELMADVLSGKSHVDFPTVTEICERSYGDEIEAAAVAELIASALADADDDSNYLKALTVAHELLYDDCACKAMLAAPGFVDGLHRAQTSSCASDTGPAGESIRVLSAELRRRLCPRRVCRL